MIDSTKNKEMIANNVTSSAVSQDRSASVDEIISFNRTRTRLGRSFKVLSFDLTGAYLKYGLFSKLSKSTRWLQAGELRSISLQNQEIEKAVAGGLDMLSGKLELDNTKILIVIDSSGFFTRRIKIPELKKEDFTEAIKWKCAKQIPYPIEEALLNIVSVEKRNGFAEVTLAVAKKEFVNRFSFLGNRLLGIIPSSLALSGNYLRQSRTDGTIDILIHWGDSEAVIDYINSGHFEFCNSFKFDSIEDNSPLKLLNLSEKVENNLKNSLDFYYSIYPGQQADQIKIHGENWQEIADRISPVVDIGVSCDNPYSSLIDNENELQSFWDTTGCKYILNAGAVRLDSKYYYLPSAIKKLHRIDRLKSSARIFSVFMVVILVLFSGMFIKERMNRLNRIESIQAQVDYIEALPVLRDAVRLKNSVDMAAKSISRLQPPRQWAAGFMRAIGHSVSSGVYFKALNLTKSNVDNDKIDIIIEGFYHGDLKNADTRLAEFVEKLNDYCGFKEDKFERLGERFEGSNKFINFALTGSAGMGQWTAE